MQRNGAVLYVRLLFQPFYRTGPYPMPTSPLTLEMVLPHRGPMLLIGEVLCFDEEGAVTRSTADAQWPLGTSEGISGLILIELVAQTAGVNNGLALRKRNGGGHQRGWIVGVKRARLMIDRIAPGTQIVVATQNGFAYENFREVHGTVRIDNQTAAEITLQLMQAK